MARVAINGLGRIGRAVLKILSDRPELELVAVNDLASAEDLAYLLKYDTVYGRYEKPVTVTDDRLMVGEASYVVLSEKDPAQLPWGDLDIDIVFECTGVFRRQEDLEKHLRAGAGYVILSAPAKSGQVATIVHGVNAADSDLRVISCASCTTNCITPVAEVMDRRIGVAKATMTTIHAYTSTQALVDAPSRSSDKRRGRAAAANLVPTSTGAALATAKALPQYEGRFSGVAVRAPVPVGSIADIVFVTERATTVEEVNDIFREEAESDRYRGILGVSEDPLVSSDIVHDARASIIDLGMTQVTGGDLVKVMSWYDNEWGYANQLVREAVQLVSVVQKS